ncbi:MAG: ABC transporter ATP-binding protein [Bacteroidetes bacterium]|nr:ABC transporter ATP-binding protein [Bacteroidota bacterium]
MLEIRGLGLSYEDRCIFSNLNFTLNGNVVYGIFGPNGTGKTSLLNIIAGYQNPTCGEIILNGEVLPLSSHRLIPGFSEMALVSATYHLDWNHSCVENIRESILGWPQVLREKRIKQLLNGLSLNQVKTVLAKRLSEGEKQRLAIARAISNNPEWLLLDEPFGHLDVVHKERLLQQLFSLGIYNVVIVSHDIQDLMGVCHKIAVLGVRGKLSKFEQPKKKYFNFKSLNTARLMGPLNQLHWEGKPFFFRPTSFSLSNEGVELVLVRAWFNGMTYVHCFKTLNKEEVILYFQTALPKVIKIIPLKDEAVGSN